MRLQIIVTDSSKMCNVPHFYNFFFPRLRSTSFDTSSFYNVSIWCKQLYHSQPLDDDQRGDAVFRDLAASIVHGGHGNLRDRAALPEAQHKVPMPPRKESRSGPSASHAGKSHRIDPGLEKVIFFAEIFRSPGNGIGAENTDFQNYSPPHWYSPCRRSEGFKGAILYGRE